ncbi:hypothetical protein GZ78_22175 [Endozoicomonas numazuensis]|uniref:Uncharacterized protein n=1 Tax=Endozoicomonas numazuensis TaxID=1137799 RepID=A0A081NDM7_9GAMM|nr:hypothetical protein GZ78_22175 [Endozoicomonas numazuensis]
MIERALTLPQKKRQEAARFCFVSQLSISDLNQYALLLKGSLTGLGKSFSFVDLLEIHVRTWGRESNLSDICDYLAEHDNQEGALLCFPRNSIDIRFRISVTIMPDES